ncbi:MAG: signal peptidase II [Holosporales bacterium]|jgi:signal peptidase II|nr:signal peptidase II [Holosporales bacterium]
MKYSKKLNFFCFLLCLLVVIFDQAAKFSILAFIPNGACINIFPSFNLTLTFNFGTSFGLLQPNTVMGQYVLIFATILCIIFLMYLFFKLKNQSEKVFCSLIIGGAIGNLCDRLIHGAVVDFLDIYYNNWHWPAFNLADSFISVSTIFIILQNLFMKRQ